MNKLYSMPQHTIPAAKRQSQSVDVVRFWTTAWLSCLVLSPKRKHSVPPPFPCCLLVLLLESSSKPPTWKNSFMWNGCKNMLIELPPEPPLLAPAIRLGCPSLLSASLSNHETYASCNGTISSPQESNGLIITFISLWSLPMSTSRTFPTHCCLSLAGILLGITATVSYQNKKVRKGLKVWTKVWKYIKTIANVFKHWKHWQKLWNLCKLHLHCQSYSTLHWAEYSVTNTAREQGL